MIKALAERIDGLNKEDYSSTSWNVLANNDATQEEVSVAENRLKTAIENLKTIDSVSNVPNNQTTPEISDRAQNKVIKSGDVKTGDNASFIGISLVAIIFLSRKKKA